MSPSIQTVWRWNSLGKKLLKLQTEILNQQVGTGVLDVMIKRYKKPLKKCCRVARRNLNNTKNMLRKIMRWWKKRGACATTSIQQDRLQRMTCSRIALLSESWWNPLVKMREVNSYAISLASFCFQLSLENSAKIGRVSMWLWCCEAEQTQVRLVWRLVIVWRPECATTVVTLRWPFWGTAIDTHLNDYDYRYYRSSNAERQWKAEARALRSEGIKW